MGAIANDWLEPLKPEFAKPYYAQLYKKVKEEYTTHQIFPPSDMIFHAFEVTPLEDVKVVILGQDPIMGWTGTWIVFFRSASGGDPAVTGKHLQGTAG